MALACRRGLACRQRRAAPLNDRFCTSQLSLGCHGHSARAL